MILLTGASGFVGKHVTEYLKREHSGKVYFYDRAIHGDLSKPKSVRKFMKRSPNIDTIIHLAANAKPKLGDNPSKMIDDNVKATMNLAEYCPDGTRFLFASSITVYGEIEGGQYGDWPVEYDRCDPLAVYPATKLCSEHILNYYSATGRVKPVHMRMPAIVGDGLTHGALKDIIRKARENNVIELFGNYPGSDKMYLYIDDLIGALDVLISNRDILGPLNICPDDHITIYKLANTVLSTLYEIGDIEDPRAISWLGSKSTWVGDNSLLRADNTLAKRILQWSPRTSEEAIIQTVKDVVT